MNATIEAIRQTIQAWEKVLETDNLVDYRSVRVLINELHGILADHEKRATEQYISPSELRKLSEDHARAKDICNAFKGIK